MNNAIVSVIAYLSVGTGAAKPFATNSNNKALNTLIVYLQVSVENTRKYCFNIVIMYVNVPQGHLATRIDIESIFF